MIQILLVAVTVLVTSISLRLFPGTRFLLIAFIAGLVLAGIFRQFIPRMISSRNPERALLLLLPFIRPFYHLFVFIADPLHKVFDRSRRERTVIETNGDEDAEDNGDDIQALIDVGEEEGILEEEAGRADSLDYRVWRHARQRSDDAAHGNRRPADYSYRARSARRD